MPNQTRISCPTTLGQGGLGYHMKFVAESSHSATGEHPIVYCTNKLKEREHIITVKSEPDWMFLCNYSPLRWMPSAINVIQQRHFDKLVARSVSKEGPITLHAFPGAAEHSFLSVKRKGGTAILEAASVHVANLQRDTAREHVAFRMHGSPFTTPWVNQVLREYEIADYVTVSSELQRQSFIQHGYPQEKLLFAPLGIDCARFCPVSDQPSLRPRRREKFRIIQVGQVSLLKGFQYTLQALEILRDPEIELVLFGGIGWRAVRQLVDSYRSNGLDIQIISGDPVPLLQTAHMCIHPSISDGFGLAPLEAMATGLPTVVSNQTGMKDLIRSGENGFIIPTRDAKAIAECIHQLKSNDSLRIAMGHAAHSSALSYDIRIRQHQYAEVMKSLWVS